MFKFKALILSVFSFKTSRAKSPNLLIFRIMSAAMTKWHLFRSCDKNRRYLTLGSVPWQSNVCLPHTNAASPLLNGCGSASNPTEWCLIITICCFWSTEKCQRFVALLWSEECEAFFQKQGGATLGVFFSISRTWRLENCMGKAPAVSPCHSLCAFSVSETLCCCS